jgi:hypothetical protein
MQWIHACVLAVLCDALQALSLSHVFGDGRISQA